MEPCKGNLTDSEILEKLVTHIASCSPNPNRFGNITLHSISFQIPFANFVSVWLLLFAILKSQQITKKLFICPQMLFPTICKLIFFSVFLKRHISRYTWFVIFITFCLSKLILYLWQKWLYKLVYKCIKCDCLIPKF